MVGIAIQFIYTYLRYMIAGYNVACAMPSFYIGKFRHMFK